MRRLSNNLLDRDDYIGYLQAIPHVAADKLTKSQRAYFLGLLAFHLGKLDDAARLITKSVNSNDKSLTSNQVESALETLGQIDFKLCRFGASAQMYDDITLRNCGLSSIGCARSTRTLPK